MNNNLRVVLVVLFSTMVFLASSRQALGHDGTRQIEKYSSGTQEKSDELKPTPLVTSKCLNKSESGDCLLSETTYGYNGVECVEECLKTDSFGKCKLHNVCRFDAGSRCFEKTVCEEIDDFGGCKTWVAQTMCQ